jgi:hypothetical protein
LVDGDLTVTGAKGAVVPHPDGSQRLFCAIESPESWFEDFGEGRLEDGAIEIELDRDFELLTRTESYHVFLTAYADSQGLYVERRTPRSFTVREQRGGKSSVSFSYRVVARRRDIDVPRFKKIEAPQAVPDSPLEEHDEFKPSIAPEVQPRHEDVLAPKPRTEDARSRPPQIAIDKPDVEERMRRR